MKTQPAKALAARRLMARLSGSPMHPGGRRRASGGHSDPVCSGGCAPRARPPPWKPSNGGLQRHAAAPCHYRVHKGEGAGEGGAAPRAQGTIPPRPPRDAPAMPPRGPVGAGPGPTGRLGGRSGQSRATPGAPTPRPQAAPSQPKRPPPRPHLSQQPRGDLQGQRQGRKGGAVRRGATARDQQDAGAGLRDAAAVHGGARGAGGRRRLSLPFRVVGGATPAHTLTLEPGNSAGYTAWKLAQYGAGWAAAKAWGALRG